VTTPASGTSGSRQAPFQAYEPGTRALIVAVLGTPVAWAVHFNGVYLIIAMWCSAGWPGARTAIVVFTLLCAAASAACGLLALRLWRRAREGLRVDAEPGDPGQWDARMGERGARSVFLLVLAMFLAAVFTLGIVLEGLPPLFAPLCPVWTFP
jgi:hypothetical protein